MSLELHVFPMSPRAFKVMSVANHLDLPWELKFVDLAAGAQRKLPQDEQGRLEVTASPGSRPAA
jgi:hypothetical protein